MNKPSLLLVDDSPDMAVIVRLLGKRCGVRVFDRSSVAAGWSSLREHQPDLLLLDMRLTAGENGAELCRLVRSSEKARSLRIALFTNMEMQEDIRWGIEAGADLLFAKNLITQSAEWQARLTEILAWTRGRVWMKLVALKTSPGVIVSSNWPGVFNQAVQQVFLRYFGTDLVRVVLLRAVQQTFVWQKRTDDDPAAWLAADGAGLNEKLVAQAADTETAALLGASLAEQVWCMLGSRDSAVFAASLAPLVPGLTEALWF